MNNNYAYSSLNMHLKGLEFGVGLGHYSIRRDRFRLVPKIGLKLRNLNYYLFYDPPYDAPDELNPRSGALIGIVNNQQMVVSTALGQHEARLEATRLAIDLEVAAWFRLSPKIWLLAGPTMAFDYDRAQNIGGLFVGLRLE